MRIRHGVDDRIADGEYARIGRRGGGDLRTDAGGVARGDGDARFTSLNSQVSTFKAEVCHS